MRLLIFVWQLIEQRMQHGCDRLTLIDKLLRLNEEHNDISISEIKGECNTIMMAVRKFKAIIME